MELWIDNTGLHAVGSCLRGDARSDYDIYGLLNLTTMLVYGDTIAVNGFELPAIADRSKAIRDELLAIGIERDAFLIQEVTEREYAHACSKAAESSALELSRRFQPDVKHMVFGVEPPDLPRSTFIRQAEYIDLADAPDDSQAVRSAAAHGLDDKAVGAMEYMMAGLPPFVGR